jgi:glycosyltransferase involved in cell wall biosynthesis
MAKNAIYLLSDEKRLAKFSRQAKERAKDFDISVVLPQYEAIYEEVTKKNLVQ